MNPAQSTTVLVRNLEQVCISPTESGTKSIKCITVNLTARENDALSNSSYRRSIDLETCTLRNRGCPFFVTNAATNALVFSVPRPRFPFGLGDPK